MKNEKNPKVKRYIEKAEEYITKGEKELKQNDLCQAGEKYWGAATQILKAYCELKGWPHDGHSLLFKDVNKISSALKNKTLIEDFGFASMLHINFYEGWLTKEEVEIFTGHTMAFINKIRKILKEEEKARRKK